MAGRLRNGAAVLSQAAAFALSNLVYSHQNEGIVMDMKLNAALIREEPEKRAWSQEHLAEATGLALRTIQRIESTGAASYESASAIASTLGLQVTQLRALGADFGVSAGPRKWLIWHRSLTVLGCGLLAAVFTPPHFRVTVPAAVALWMGCELAIKTRLRAGGRGKEPCSDESTG